MHLDDEQVQRVLHGELHPSVRDAVTRHAAECDSCRRRVDEAAREEAWVFDRLRVVDHAPPAVDSTTLAGRGRRTAPPWGRRAAGILLALAAVGAAYAAPGSPLRRWVTEVLRPDAGRGTPAPAPSGPDSALAVTGGIAVTPGERLVIRFAATQAEGAATVWVASRSDVLVRTLNGTATFSTAADRLDIENRGSAADYEIEVPVGAGPIEIRLGDRRLLLKENGRVVADVPPDGAGRYRLPLGARAP
jgi:hypothetical protein